MKDSAPIVVLALVIIMGVILCSVSYTSQWKSELNYINNHWYPQCGIITEIYRKADMMVITDSTGNEWLWEGVEDFQTRDHVSMVMDDNGTDFVSDDKILKIQYMGIY